jgi:hypothetical protein
MRRLREEGPALVEARLVRPRASLRLPQGLGFDPTFLPPVSPEHAHGQRLREAVSHFVTVADVHFHLLG